MRGPVRPKSSVPVSAVNIPGIFCTMSQGATLGADRPHIGVRYDGIVGHVYPARLMASAASDSVSVNTTGRPDSSRMRLPSSTLVPSIRTTTGRVELALR
jgi:hypothetical protein